MVVMVVVVSCDVKPANGLLGKETVNHSPRKPDRPQSMGSNSVTPSPLNTEGGRSPDRDIRLGKLPGTKGSHLAWKICTLHKRSRDHFNSSLSNTNYSRFSRKKVN